MRSRRNLNRKGNHAEMRWAQSRESLQRLSGYRSEVSMKKIFILIILGIGVFKVDAQTQPIATQLLNLISSTADSISLIRTHAVSSKKISLKELERRAFEILNQRRMERGLTPLVWNPELAMVARLHSENMARNKFFSHVGIDGSLVSDRAGLFGIKKWRAIGENIAYNRGFDDPVSFACDGWMRSDGHRENLLSVRWKESAVGIAIAEDGTYYFTQVFLER